jgi:long-chain acyl-CoA synthetase
VSQATTVPRLLLQRVAATPEAPAFSVPSGNSWVTHTWAAFLRHVRELAMGLVANGLQPQARVALLCSTRYDWVLADLAVLCAGGTITTIYPSSLADECAYIINDSTASIVIAENEEQVAKLAAMRAQTPSVQCVFTIDGKPSADGWVRRLDDLRHAGSDALQADFESHCLSVQPDHLATIMYTSGTTGEPKGVELTHDNWVYEAWAMESLKLLSIDDFQYLWLPLAHAFGKVLEVAQLAIGYHTAIDGRPDKLMDNLAKLEPTFVAAVPRIFEKLQARILEQAKRQSMAPAAVFTWALDVGKKMAALRRARQEPSRLLSMQYAAAQRLVLGDIRARFGQRLRFCISGSAPLAQALGEFFDACGVLVLEGYGLTESSAASFISRPSSVAFGSVGPPLPGTSLRLSDDGEVLLSGRGVMRGYRGKAQETAEVLKDGWLATGDLGELDADGRLCITGRKKDLIKTSGGKYVAPQDIEGRFKASCPVVSQAVVHGDNRPFCTMLVTLEAERIAPWAQRNGLPADLAAIAQDPRTHAYLKGFVQELNRTLPSFATIKNFAILPNDLSEAAGELTPSLKVKRRVVEAKHRALLDGFYAGKLVDL